MADNVLLVAATGDEVAAAHPIHQAGTALSHAGPSETDKQGTFIMRKFLCPTSAVASIAIGLAVMPVNMAAAADHSFTATAAGGLTTSSQPFQNGLNNPGRNADSVPGQGSPLSGEDHMTPATDTTNSGQVKTNPAYASGKTAPSQNSDHFSSSGASTTGGGGHGGGGHGGGGGHH